MTKVGDSDSTTPQPPEATTPSTPEGPQTCFNVKMVTTDWAEEIFWGIFTPGCYAVDDSCPRCHSPLDENQHQIPYENNQEYNSECCMPKDKEEFEIQCVDVYGDGWHGGYLEINGVKYCDDFEGFDKVVSMPNPDSGMPFT